MTWLAKLLELAREGAVSEAAALELLAAADATGLTPAPAPQAQPIAVVGMAARAPGAESIDELWDNLRHGRSAITGVPVTRWAPEQYVSDDPEHPRLGQARQGGFLLDPFAFDPEFFDLAPAQAVMLDPQQRLMLEVAWEVFEQSGYVGHSRHRRPIGVFVGARMNAYGFDHFRQLPGAAPQQPQPLGAPALWGRSQNFIASWISDRLDLAGPSLVVDTACSSSLTALWLACQSLRAGACELALAGGVDLLIDPLTMVMLSRAGALSPDGRCWTFDRRANGYVPGEGAGAVLLRPLDAAVRDGDRVLGVIRAAVANNDGHTMGVTTPSLDAQKELLARAYQEAGVDPRSVGYLEAHGTGTAIGDPIELKALTEIFAAAGAALGQCAIGTIKANIGHLHSAAGIVSVIKALLCLQHGQIPPNLNCDEPNPRLGIDTTPFRLPRALEAWPAGDSPRRAGVSSFGFGGTNGHVIVEEAPRPPADAATVEAPVADLLVLSARDSGSLQQLVADLVHELDRDPPAALGDLCASSRLGRRHERVRVAVVGASIGELRAGLVGALVAGFPQPAPETALIWPPPQQQAVAAWRFELAGWLPAFREASEEFARAVTVVDGMGSALARAAAAYTLGRGLLALGVPAQQLRLPAALEPLARCLRGELALGAALGALAAADPPHGGEEPPGSDDLATRLTTAAARGEPAKAVLLELLAALFAGGATLHWDQLQGERPWRKAALPRSVLCPRTYNLDEPLRSPRRAPSLAPRVHPLIDDARQDADGGVTFGRRFDARDVFLRQHAVYHTFMLPGVAWLEFVRAGQAVATGAASTHRWLRISDLVFHGPLVVDHHGAEAVGRIEPDGTFEVRRPGTAGAEGRYATGRITPQQPPQLERVDLSALGRQLRRIVPATQIYRRLRAMGYDHGPYYRNIAWIAAAGEQTVLARIDGARQAVLNPAGIALFPGLLDSVTVAAVGPNTPAMKAGDQPEAFVPLSIECCDVLGDLAEAAFVLTEVHFWSDESCRCTQTVTDSTGNRLLVFANIASKRVPLAAWAARAPEPRAASSPPAPSTWAVETAPDPSAAPEGLALEAGTTAAHAARSASPVLDWLLGEMGKPGQHELSDTQFLSAGFDSASLLALAEQLERAAAIRLYPTVFFEYPTPHEMAAFLAEQFPERFAELLAQPAPPAEPERPAGVARASSAPSTEATPVRPTWPEPASDETRPIAVIGMSVRVPGASTLDEFWALLQDGADMIRPLPPARWDPQIHLVAEGGTPVPCFGGFLEQVDEFDCELFGVSPREAPDVDPQARIFYEVAWEALEHAGYAGPGNRGSRTGVWVGYSHDHYYEERVRAGVASGRGLGLQVALPNRLSYRMDWHGPSLVVNTLCSSSLVALHQSCRSLRAGECDMALAGGVHLALSPEYYRSMHAMEALSPAGRCRAFDAAADGYVPGEGAGAVVLKGLDEALRDGDQVLAVIRGSAVNHGGRASRLSAPNLQAQTSVLLEAWRDAGIDPSTLGLIEAHGTGTRLGDPVEVAALRRAFDQHTSARQFCGIGSLKSQIGHLESAAGIASVIKVVLSLQHATLAPTIHLERPNPDLDLERSALFVIDRVRPWPAEPAPRRAGVSAFGMLGVNAHVVLEEAPARPAQPVTTRPVELLRLSAHTPRALQQLAAAYIDILRQPQAAAELPHLVHTANLGRAELRYRTAVFGADPGELVQALTPLANGAHSPDRRPAQRPTLAFLFTGQGSQYPRMAHDLAAAEPVVRASLAHSAAIVADLLPVPLDSLLVEPDGQTLTQTRYAQVAIAAVEWALVELFASWGVQPDLVLGHSLGEYIAAAAAGVFTWPDALRLVTTRARLMQRCPAGGAMAALHADHSTARAALTRHDDPRIQIAAVNSPTNTVVTGPAEAVQAFCAAAGLPHQLLRVSHAFHSTAMAPAAEALAEAVAATPRQVPRLPLAANLTGGWHTPASAADPGYWAAQMQQPVQFSAGIHALAQAGAQVFWELGPKPDLTALGQQTLGSHQTTWLTTLRPGAPAHRELLSAVARYYGQGLGDIDWDGMEHGLGRCTIPLPTYPFQRQRFWLAPSGEPARATAGARPTARTDAAVIDQLTEVAVSGPPHPLLGSRTA
ncbi:MAG: acyltransferase domain-containing protein [Chloroflexi bacterium]|nr:acyltransferase domain-containing protein [Chloroflexota bacterium]